jgi:TolB-like protein/DNA-binding winged helix-turn-helix (wHTH) protein/tetratricopeptide (TPR) repeat protein
MDASSPKRYEFGGFSLDPSRRMLLEGDGRPVEIPTKAFDFLLYLVRNAGRVVERAELMDAVWPRAIVEENTLSQAVLRVRSAIGEGVVVTVRGRGYQFAESVRIVAAGDDASQDDAKPEAGNRLRPAPRGLRQALAVVVVLALGLVAVGGYRYLASPAVPVSIVVLPFENVSTDPDQEYFADGLTEALIGGLSGIDGLDVRGRISSFYYKGRSEDLPAIAEQLNVEYVLDGSVLKSGGRLRVTPQLIDARTGSIIWLETYDQRPIGDVFAIQDDIVREVANALEVKLRVGRGRLPGMTHDVDAYDAYLRGSTTPEALLGGRGTLRAIEHFERAVALDESFSLAWVLMGRTYNARAGFGPSGNRRELRRQAEAAFDRARTLTPDSPHVLLNEAQRHANRGELREAGALFERLPTLVAEYGDDDGYFRFETALFLARVGRTDEATSILEAFKRTEPLSRINAAFLGQAYTHQRNFEAALEEFDRGLRIEGDVELEALPLLRGAAFRAALAMRDRAEIERRLAASLGDVTGPTSGLHAFLDHPADGLAEVRRIEASGSAERPLELGTLAQWAAYYGDPEYALSLLRRLSASGGNGVLWNEIWQPYMHDVRKLAGFQDLARDLGLVEYWREYGWADFCRPVDEDDFECE